jgi:hypothetical protein
MQDEEFYIIPLRRFHYLFRRRLIVTFDFTFYFLYGSGMTIYDTLRSPLLSRSMSYWKQMPLQKTQLANRHIFYIMTPFSVYFNCFFN